MRSTARRGSLRSRSRAGWFGLLFGCLVLGGGVPTAQEEETSLAAKIARLDAEGEAVWDELEGELVLTGEAGAAAALAEFEAAGPIGRRLRARLVAETAGPGNATSLLELLRTGSLAGAVRVDLVHALGRSALGEAELEARVEELTRRARDEADPTVRSAALEALAELGSPEAIAALDRLLLELPAPESQDAAERLASLAAGRLRLVARVRSEFAAPVAERRLSPRTLAVLLEAYGRALAELPGGAAGAAERAPLVLGRVHPAAPVRRASRQALDRAQARLLTLQEYERADRLLADLAADGVTPREMLYRRAQLALAQKGDAGLALELAEALLRDTAGARTPDERTWRFYGLHFRAAAQLARGEYSSARAGFAETAELLQGLLAEREDLRPSLHRRIDWPASPFGGSILVDRRLNLALVEVWQAVCLLAEKGDPAERAVLEHLRQANVIRLRAQLTGLVTDAEFSSNSMDDFLDRDLGPRRLLFSNPRLEGWGEGRGVDLQLLLGRALATVSPEEFPGFEPVEIDDPLLGDPFLDDRRFSLMFAIQDAEFEGAWRAWWVEQREMQRRATLEEDPSLVGPEARRNHPAYWRVLAASNTRQQQDERARRLTAEERLEPARRRELFPEFARYRTPSNYALTLSGELRGDGRAEAARQLAAGMLADLRTLTGVSAVWVEWISAQLETAIGAAFMDEDRAPEAEEQYLAAEARLSALENTLRQDRDRMAESDPARARTMDAQIERTRLMRADVFLSLAVNANVRLGDQEKAYEYFEQGFEIDQRDFMRALRACYRARVGEHLEARAALRRLRPAPPLYYNLACTHALLGETDQALDYLQRDFEENHPSAGSLRRQQEWANSDPDLSSLREHPRFQRLIGQ